MNENLIVEDNTIYEIDPECLRKKRERQERETNQDDKKEIKNEKIQKKDEQRLIGQSECHTGWCRKNKGMSVR